MILDVPSDFLVWHDQFKTAVLAQAATFGLVAADTTPITNDNTDIHAKVTSVNSTSPSPPKLSPTKTPGRANANKHARALAARIKGASRYHHRNAGFIRQSEMSLGPLPDKSGVPAGIDQTGGVVELDFDK